LILSIALPNGNAQPRQTGRATPNGTGAQNFATTHSLEQADERVAL